MAACGLLFSQAVASGGWLDQAAETVGPRAQALGSAFGGLVLLYPDICVTGLFTLVFWLQSFLGLWLCLVALTVLVPAQRDPTRQRAGVYVWSAIFLATFSLLFYIFRTKNPSYPFRLFF